MLHKNTLQATHNMEQYGIIIGAGLLVIVTACAWLLGAKANAAVRRFREEHHESFLGQRKP